MNNWTDIKEQRPPDNKVVLVYVTNTDGGSGVCLASFAAKHTLEADDEAFGDLIDYCEEEDTCYAPEGWYEYAEHHQGFGLIYMPDDCVTHWMGLPEKPLCM